MRISVSPLVAALVAASTVSALASGSGVVHFVNQGAEGANDGTSWVDAFTDLQLALKAAQPGDQIWIAAGVYTPAPPGGSVESTFPLPAGIEVYGGFVGTESDLAERDWLLNETILSGDLNGDDGPNFTNRDDNVRNVITATANQIPISTLDGLIIRGGHAESGPQLKRRGGGIYAENARLHIRNCTFTSNSASTYGGGAYWVTALDVLIEDCLFLENRSYSRGGGLSIDLGHFSQAVVRRTRFEGNLTPPGSSNGAGLSSVSDSHLHLVDCDFVGNTSGGSGGAAYLIKARVVNCRFLGNKSRYEGGAVRAGSDVKIANCLFSGNTVGLGYPLANTQRGGAIFVTQSTGHASIVNSVMVNNWAQSTHGGVYAQTPTTVADLANSILWNNSDQFGSGEAAQAGGPGVVTFDHCIVEGWSGALGGEGNSGQDPMFVDALGQDGVAGTEDDDFRLQATSPAIDAGNNLAVPPDYVDLNGDGITLDQPLPLDLAFNQRFHDDPDTTPLGKGTVPIVDIGAYEFGAPDITPGLYVGKPGGSWFDSNAWSGSELPSLGTDVYIDVPVVIDQMGATARNVIISDGGSLTIANGSLEALNVTVLAGGGLHLIDSEAAVYLHSLNIHQGADFTWLAGTIVIDEGKWTHPEVLTVGCRGAANLMLIGGAIVEAPTVQICSSGVAGGVGTLSANVINGGHIAPGLPLGDLHVSGALAQTSVGTINLMLVDLVSGLAAPRLVVGGDANIDGQIHVETSDGFEPVLGSNDVMLAASLTLAASVLTPELPTGYIAQSTVTNQSVLIQVSPQGTRLYVNAAAGEAGGGIDWSNPTNDLAAALKVARDLPGQFSEIWVAAGTYVPTEEIVPGEAFSATFQLVDGLTLYGGFFGNENDVSERDIEANPTILSGDVDGDDGPDFSNRLDNVSRVLTATQTTSATVDGFIVTGGHAIGAYTWTGGGLWCPLGGSVTLRNCTFQSNFAPEAGGAIYNEGVILAENCSFIDNATTHQVSTPWGGHGGAVMNKFGDDKVFATATFKNCFFQSNKAMRGGGVGADAGASVTVLDSAFVENRALITGAGIWAGQSTTLTASDTSFTGGKGIEAIDVSGGGAFIHNATAQLTNCTFDGNVGYVGGALSVSNSDVQVIDCTFTGNTANRFGGAVELGQTSGMFTGCVFSNNSAGEWGGAVMSAGAASQFQTHAAFLNCVFEGNMAGTPTFPGHGGALATSLHGASGYGPALKDCHFQANHATAQGGAMRLEMGMAILDSCSFVANSAPEGSAIYNMAGMLHGTGVAAAGQDVRNALILAPGIPGPNGSPVGQFMAESFTQSAPIGAAEPPRLLIDIAGPGPAIGHDVIDAATASVSGLLLVSLKDGFQPVLGDMFPIVRSESLSGKFNIALLPGLEPGLLWHVLHEDDDVVLAVEEYEGIISFSAPATWQLEGEARSAVLADFSNNGLPDLAVALAQDPIASPGTIAVLANAGLEPNGSWSGFALTSVSQVGADPVEVVAGDFNGNGFVDLAVANRLSSTVSIMMNSGAGDGLFLEPVDVPLSGLPVSLAVMQAEIALSQLVVATVSPSQIITLENDGDGSFTVAIVKSFPSVPRSIVSADLTGDGGSDIAIVGQESSGSTSFVWVYSDLFSEPQMYAVGGHSAKLIVADFDNDGFLDVVTTGTHSSSSVTILPNSGTGSLLPGVMLPAGTQAGPVVAMDVDSDGDMDLLLGARNQANVPAVRLVRNDLDSSGTIALSQISDLLSAFDAKAIVAGDLNANGIDDIVLIGKSLAEGGPAGNNAGTAIFAMLAETAPVPGDLNGDGTVGVEDLLILLAAWGPCAEPTNCPADLDGDGAVGIADLLILLANWG